MGAKYLFWEICKTKWMSFTGITNIPAIQYLQNRSISGSQTTNDVCLNYKGLCLVWLVPLEPVMCEKSTSIYRVRIFIAWFDCKGPQLRLGLAQRWEWLVYFAGWAQWTLYFRISIDSPPPPLPPAGENHLRGILASCFSPDSQFLCPFHSLHFCKLQCLLCLS